MKNEKAIPKKIEKLIYQEASSHCPFCGTAEIHVLHIHHIKPRSNGGENAPDNLILVCANCHEKIKNGIISETEILQKKNSLRKTIASEADSSIKQMGQVIRLNGSINTGIIANKLIIKRSGRQAIKLTPPYNTIAADRDKRNYIKHLIDRYNKFAKDDPRKRDFKYPLIYKAIEREFKCKWDFVPIERFDDLVAYLHKRINNTFVGRINQGKGHCNYSSFEEFMEKVLG